MRENARSFCLLVQVGLVVNLSLGFPVLYAANTFAQRFWGFGVGTVILSPDLYGLVTIFYMIRYVPDQDLGLFRPGWDSYE